MQLSFSSSKFVSRGQAAASTTEVRGSSLGANLLSFFSRPKCFVYYFSLMQKKKNTSLNHFTVEILNTKN